MDCGDRTDGALRRPGLRLAGQDCVGMLIMLLLGAPFWGPFSSPLDQCWVLQQTPGREALGMGDGAVSEAEQRPRPCPCLSLPARVEHHGGSGDRAQGHPADDKQGSKGMGRGSGLNPQKMKGLSPPSPPHLPGLGPRARSSFGN